MIDSSAPGAWKFENWTIAKVRKHQQETTDILTQKAAEFDGLGDIDTVYKLRCFCDGYLHGLKNDGVMGDGLAALKQMITSAEGRAKRRITKALGIHPPYRLPTLKEWSSRGVNTPQIKLPRLTSTRHWV